MLISKANGTKTRDSHPEMLGGLGQVPGDRGPGRGSEPEQTEQGGHTDENKPGVASPVPALGQG